MIGRRCHPCPRCLPFGLICEATHVIATTFPDGTPKKTFRICEFHFLKLLDALKRGETL